MPIGIDWGGTTIKAAIVDGAAVRGFARIETGGEPAAILDAIAGLVRVLDPRTESVGVAIPGEVRPDGRCWRLPNVPGFEDVNIGAELHARLGLPIGVENDATAAALAERLYGWGNQYGSFLLVTLGTGVGGGLVLDGHVRRGTNGFAGEIGHVLVESGEQAWTCGCGKRGCMEAYAGIAGLLRKYAAVKGSDPLFGTKRGSDPLWCARRLIVSGSDPVFKRRKQGPTPASKTAAGLQSRMSRGQVCLHVRRSPCTTVGFTATTTTRTPPARRTQPATPPVPPGGPKTWRRDSKTRSTARR